MESRNDNIQKANQGHHQNPSEQKISDDQKSLNESAHMEADRDMDHDAELTAQNSNDDLDEGESARLGEDLSNII